MSYKKLLTVLPCAALWVAMPPKAAAQEPQQPQPPRQQPQQQSQQQGMVVVRDAKTGQLRAPTPAEIRALTPQQRSSAMRAPSQPALVTHPGGSRQVRLGERGLVYSVVTRGADGKLDEHCVHGEAAAEQAVKGSGAAAASAPDSASTSVAPHTEDHHHD